MPTTAGTQVAEFVRVLALGWKNLAAYPPGHPALAGSLDLIFRRLNDLRGPGGDVVFGIARDGLIYGKEKIDSTGAQKFAQALYTRGVALLRFETSVEPRDIETFLRLLASPPAAAMRPLWEEILRALVAGRELSKDGQEILSREMRSIEQLTELVAEFLQEASEP